MSRTEVLDPYNTEQLQMLFGEFEYQFNYISVTPTTMKLAEAHARAGSQLPAIFLADHQTQGIGREGRTWTDSPGSSILATGLFKINPNVTPIYGDLVALRACSAIATLTKIDIGIIGIKYPNDLVIDGKKVAGILVRNVLGDSVDSTKYFGTMVGIGINVHYSEDETSQIPTEYGATALDLHTPHPNSRQAILVAIFGKFRYLSVDAEVIQTNSYAQEKQNRIWRECSTVLGRMIRIESDEKVFIEGTVADTPIGKGILVETGGTKRWFNQFDTPMKVRMLN